MEKETYDILNYEQMQNLESEGRVKYQPVRGGDRFFAIVDGKNLYHDVAKEYDLIARNIHEDLCIWRKIAEGDDEKRKRNAGEPITLGDHQRCYDCDGTFKKGITLDCAEYISDIFSEE